MRLLKIAVVAVFAALTAACFFLSDNNLLTKIDSPKEVSTESFFQHALTVQKADAKNVKGDFENENFLFYNGVKAEMTKIGNEFFASFETDDKKEIFKIESVVGAKNVQQYIADKNGETILLPIAYDLKKNRWLNSNEMFLEEKDADFFKNQKDWKTDCAACHLEKPDETQKNFDVSNLNSNSILLACGSCHAKGLHESFPKMDEIISRKHYSEDLISAHRNAPRNDENFFADGSTRMAAHEYQGILRSVCFVNSKSSGNDSLGGEKINCLSCHSPESGKVADVKSDEKLLSGQACISCHQQFSSSDAIAEHTKHRLDSEASNCYSCHMPEIAYGHLRFQRTHEIGIPDPALTVKKNVPNACNLCHTDQSVNWAILSSKKLWPEHFLDSEISTDKQFDKPEYIRVRALNDSFLKALMNSALQK